MNTYNKYVYLYLQVDGLHPDHFDNSTRLPRDIASGSSSLERELGGAAELTDRVIEHTSDVLDEPDNSTGIVGPGAVIDDATPEVDTPEEPPVFVCDTYTDVIGMQEVCFFFTKFMIFSNFSVCET